METRELLDALGYTVSPNCLTGSALRHAPDYGHIFRRAIAGAGLEAVYCLRQPTSDHTGSPEIVPVSYICKATSYEHADEIHRLVWNQNVVPLVVVLAPQGVRVYTGFEHRERPSHLQYVLDSDFANVTSRLAAISASSIDNGSVWDEFAGHVRPERRVEWHLLTDLAELEKILIQEGLTEPSLVHTLIGKLLYLYYLRHRGILSDVRLAKWNLTWEAVASRTARVSAFLRVCAHLEEWLNGSVFPLTTRMMNNIGTDHLQRAAAVFGGDSPHGQQHLAFDAYDFSYIPIETLSVVYEQFLHLRETSGGASVGRKQGAYYTPLPVVNFIIDRMDEVSPLQSGMRILDPACGSGAFLVQCYRKLIEDRLRSAPTEKIRPTDLRDLLTRSIFGVDVDAEACRVAELSLLLTMLDYIDPPDLTNTNFKLPNLSGTNIIEANTFDDSNEFIIDAKLRGFDWVIGNPPWNELSPKTQDPIEKPLANWITANKTEMPTGGNQTAEPFLWRARELVRPAGLVGMLIPAMVLFKTESRAFRERFFGSTELVYLANFSNLAEVLFAGRSRVPAAALIVRARLADGTNRVPVFSPLIANQELTRPRMERRRVQTWSIVVNENEMRFIDPREVPAGDAIFWKISAWGSDLDRSILRRTSGLRTLQNLIDEQDLLAAEGMELRGKPRKGGEPLEHHPELIGDRIINTEAMARLRQLFALPDRATVEIHAENAYVRKGRFEIPNRVSDAPHIVVNATRNWAIFSDTRLIVPPRQIGIAGPGKRAHILKALTLYLNSQFVQYHQFFASPQAGVKREVSTLRALRALPVPDCLFSDMAAIESWALLHDELVADDMRTMSAINQHQSQRRKTELLAELNTIVNSSLQLREQDEIRISDFVEVLLGLRDGKVEDHAVRPPDDGEQRVYAERLQTELDAFIGAERGVTHAVDVWSDSKQGVVRIDLRAGDAGVTVHSNVNAVNTVKQATDLRDLLASQFSQWRYFNRNLRVFAHDRLYLFKPMQRFHWLESQAIQDAGEVVGLVLRGIPVSA